LIDFVFTNKTILLVDDEPAWRGRVMGALAEAGYDVMSARDASEALARGTQSNLGLMIMDDHLEGESSLMLTKFLHLNNPKVPILLHTTSDYDEVAVLDMMQDGVNQCLPKGNIQDLVTTVGCYLS
jgi:CheY-like chemotaxis protein